MIFGAKYKSFKIFVVVLGLIGATFAPDCQAERNPVSLDKQSQLKTLVSEIACTTGSVGILSSNSLVSKLPLQTIGLSTPG